MSLINDALKRASEAQKKRDAASPPGQTLSGPALVPAESPRRSAPPFLVPSLLVLALALGGWFLWGWWSARSVPATVATAQPTAMAAARPPAGATGPASAPGPAAPRPGVNLTPVERPAPNVRAPAPHLDKSPKAVAASPVTTSPAAATPAVATPPARQEFPALKLQGIYYRLSSPSALINGKTLYVGDEIDDAKLVKIERFNVTMQFGAETRVFKLQ